MIRILHVVTKMDAGGIETLLMNFYREIDKSKVQFDFLLHRTEKGFYDDEINRLGGKLYYVPSISILKHKRYLKALDVFFSKHSEYRIVHSHINAFSMFVLRAAKNHSIPIRIAHSHIANPSFSFIKTPVRCYCIAKIKEYCTHMFACSEMAGQWLYGKNVLTKSNFRIINNAIDSEKFVFNPPLRDKLRKELKVEEKTVLIHVGRFTNQKNHHFIIELFNLYHKLNSESCLLLFGEGPLFNKIKSQIKKYSLEESVYLMGVKDNINEYMMAADCFVFPSIYEGLGIVAIEAQTAGLLTICSKYVPIEANISSLYHSEILDCNRWVEIINNNIPYFREINNVAIENNYDIKVVTAWLQNFYLNAATIENAR